jgi:NADPH:quinone reductase-like Zn-dependent oxidoreductase
MHAAAIDHFGGVEAIQFRDVPVPDVGPYELLIKVETAGVGAWDPFEREGGFAKMMGAKPKFPYVLGTDGAGTVAAVGDRVRNFKPGDHVYGLALANPKGGFYAEYVALPADHAAPIPGALTTEQAGVMPVDAITALMGLDDTLHLQPGESLMIYGASGGIGHLAVQLAKLMGARVLAVASGADGVAMVRQLGADAVLDGRKDDVVVAARKFAPGASGGIDCALVTAGGAATDRALSAIRDGGRVAYPSGVEPEPKVRPTIDVRRYDGMPQRGTIEKLNRLIDSGPFQVHVAQTFPLDKAAEAQRALEHHYLGKLALRPQ